MTTSTHARPADDSAPGAIDAFNDRLRAEGRWVFGGGLTDPTAILAIPTALEFLRSLLGSMEALMQRNHDEVRGLRDSYANT